MECLLLLLLVLYDTASQKSLLHWYLLVLVDVLLSPQPVDVDDNTMTGSKDLQKQHHNSESTETARLVPEGWGSVFTKSWSRSFLGSCLDHDVVSSYTMNVTSMVLCRGAGGCLFFGIVVFTRPSSPPSGYWEPQVCAQCASTTKRQ